MQLDKRAFGLTLGTLMGVCLFLCTLWAMFRGGGGHLEMLKRFYLGYSISLAGAFIGLVYAFIDGLICGWIFAWLYNKLARPAAAG
ncbi:MAG: bacteriophage holin [Acidobacteria bacterium]|nr:bacteriophage holin [Acidobacteriota bacterium]MCZ6726366.1 bacteriophage holin [Acidobacteriota bacterium]